MADDFANVEAAGCKTRIEDVLIALGQSRLDRVISPMALVIYASICHQVATHLII